MILGVIGSRTFNAYDLLSKTLGEYKDITRIVSGGAKGADSVAEAYAFRNSIPFMKYLPDWEKYGKVAGIVRNRTIVNKSDHIVAFWDMQSPGTRDSIEYAKTQGKPVDIISFDKHEALRKSIKDQKTYSGISRKKSS